MLSNNKIKLACAPIAWTNDDLPELGAENTFEQCISEMALAGFTGSEVGRKYPKDLNVLKQKLALRGIQICNAWFSSKFTSKPYDETVQSFREHMAFLKALGAKIIGASEQGNSIQGKPVSIFKEKPVFTDEQWETVAKGYNELGKIARENDMYFTVHHHMGTAIQTMAEVDKLMALTDPECVYLLYDTGHFAYCDEDPLTALSKYKQRIKHIHLKDIRPAVIQNVKANDLSFLDGVRMGTFTVPGDGAIDFEPIFQELADCGYEGYMVVEAEQDPAVANPFEYALKARAYIKEKGGI